MKRYRIRVLRPDEPTPPGKPKRYRNTAGYIRLRWLVGTQTYVEVYEHRLKAGMPDDSMHVHHINGIKDDNRPENLMVVTPQEHGRMHEELARIADPDQGNHFGGYRSQAAQEKAARRQARIREQTDRAIAMRSDYTAGLSTVEIAEKYGVNSGTVSRWLRSAGTPMRRRSTDPVERVRELVKVRSQMQCEVCARPLRYEPSQVHHRRPRAMGGTSRPETNGPQNLLHTCVPCHRKIESDRSWALGHGYLVRQYQEPAETPILIWGHGWVLLAADGTYTPSTDPFPVEEDAA